MPRRNAYLLLAVGLLSVVCYHKVHKSRYSQSLVDVFELVQRKYVEPIDGVSLFGGAVEGMMDQLDENSRYFDRLYLKEFKESLDQQFGGVGMEVSLDPESKQPLVMSPLVGSPAYEAGIRAGDRILAIDGRSTAGNSLDELIKRLRGEPGQRVTVTVLHADEDKPVDIAIVRAVIQLDTVLGDSRNPDNTWNFFLQGYDRIGYVRLSSFSEHTTQELAAALRWLSQRQMRGLILDLRNNPGGLLEDAVAICDLFVREGTIVTTRGRNQQVKKAYSASGDAPYGDLPLAVIVNQYSASAAEILAACLQDHHRAIVVGERSFGKGTVQELIELDEDQGAIKLTTASYWRPSGKNIHKTKDADRDDPWGVSPDKGFQVLVDKDDLVRWIRWRHQRDARHASPNGHVEESSKPFADPPLIKAAEYLDQMVDKK